MPTVEGSAGVIKKYADASGSPKPVNWFPRRTAAEDRAMHEAGGGSVDFFQLKDDAAGVMGARTIEEFVAASEDHGYDGWILDTGHTANEQPLGRGVISNVGRSVPALAYGVQAVHFSVNRQDLGGEVARRTRTDGLRLLTGKPLNGVTAEMLAEVGKNSPVQYGVIEATIPDVAALVPEAFPGITNPKPADLHQAYQMLVYGFCHAMGRTPNSHIA